jgi:hypothetical protein
MLWGLGIAAVATVFVVIATRVIVFKTEELSTAQDQRNAAKDRQLALELKDKDLKIEDARRKTAELEADNLDLLRVVGMRRHISGSDHGKIVATLSAIIEDRDIRVHFQSFSDSEPEALLGQIRAWIAQASWRGIYDGVFGINAVAVRPGVEICTTDPSLPGMLPDTKDVALRAWRAGEATTERLRTSGIRFVEHKTIPQTEMEARRSPVARLGAIGVNGVLILVGRINTDGELEVLRKQREQRQSSTHK